MPSETILKAKTNTQPSNTLLFGRLSSRSNQATQHWNGTSETPLPHLRQINALAIVSVPPNETSSQGSDGDGDDGASTARQDVDDDEGLSFHSENCSWVTLVTILVKPWIWRRGSRSS
ncbi:hypothetical protein BT69DRAFT_1290991 [Atractiella rhizophila]|nr:hypothetical protein BT69DRAFT_1290991 [Atractiella rhizophila]